MTENSHIRPLDRDDLERVANLRQSSFDRSEHSSLRSLQDYMEWLFFDSPWADDEIRSLVALNNSGVLDGFLGLLTHDIGYRGSRLRMAVSTQLMVRERAATLTAVRLLRQAFDGAQDLTYSNHATDDVRNLWKVAGGRVLRWQSHRWYRPLRPFRWSTGHIGRGIRGRALRLLLRPVCSGLDRMWRRWGRDAFPLNPSGHRSPLTPQTGVAASRKILSDQSSQLWPSFRERELAVIFSEVEKKGHGTGTTGSVVRDPRGEALGWYLYHTNPGGESRVPALLATPDRADCVLSHLFAQAHDDGAVVVSGQLMPHFSDVLSEMGAFYQRTGPWTLAHTERDDLDEVLEDEGLALTEVDGEAWLRF